MLSAKVSAASSSEGVTTLFQDEFEFNEGLIADRDGLRPPLAFSLVDEEDPPAPESKLSRPLQRKMGKGPYRKTTPVSVQLDLEDPKVAERYFIAAGRQAPIRHQVPLFNIFSVRLPNEFIQKVEDDPGVKRVFFDAQVPFPGPEVSFKPGGNLENIRSQLNQLGPGIASVISLGAGQVGTRGRQIPDEWTPTSTTRDLLGSKKAAADSITGAGVKVAALDTGVPLAKASHPQLKNVQGLYWTPTPLPDRSGHGPHVLSIIGGSRWNTPNGAMLEGVAPGATMAGVKVLETPLGVGRDSDILKGLEIAFDWGAQIINMSLGSEGYDPDNMFEDPLLFLVKNGVIPIVAVGNSGPDPATVNTPAGSLNCIAVGSVNSITGNVAGFSSRGPAPITGAIKPDVVSFGGDNIDTEMIYSTTSPGSTLDKLDGRVVDRLAPAAGSSQATPHFAGVVAWWAEFMREQVGRELTFSDVKSVLRKMGHSPDNNEGYGLAVYDWIKVLGGT